MISSMFTKFPTKVYWINHECIRDTCIKWKRTYNKKRATAIQHITKLTWRIFSCHSVFKLHLSEVRPCDDEAESNARRNAKEETDQNVFTHATASTHALHFGKSASAFDVADFRLANRAVRMSTNTFKSNIYDKWKYSISCQRQRQRQLLLPEIANPQEQRRQ